MQPQAEQSYWNLCTLHINLDSSSHHINHNYRQMGVTWNFEFNPKKCFYEAFHITMSLVVRTLYPHVFIAPYRISSHCFTKSHNLKKFRKKFKKGLFSLVLSVICSWICSHCTPRYQSKCINWLYWPAYDSVLHGILAIVLLHMQATLRLWSFPALL